MPRYVVERTFPNGLTVPPGAEGDSPAWSRKRQPYEPPAGLKKIDTLHVPYAELHCHSAYSFLDGASHPEQEKTALGRRQQAFIGVANHVIILLCKVTTTYTTAWPGLVRAFNA